MLGIIHITQWGGSGWLKRRARAKESALRRHHALNPRPQAVTDAAFTSGNPFFDARDLVQVKYEMLRRVREDGQPVSQAAADFGFSRPSFYQAQAVFDADGLPGLCRSGRDRSGRTSSPRRSSTARRSAGGRASLNSAQLARLVGGGARPARPPPQRGTRARPTPKKGAHAEP